MPAIRKALLVLAAAVLALLPATVGQRPPVAAQEGHRVYRFPQPELDAADACYRREREARGIPGDRAGYVAWWNAHAGTQARADWHRAYERCQARYLTTSPWDYEHMVRVR